MTAMIQKPLLMVTNLIIFFVNFCDNNKVRLSAARQRPVKLEAAMTVRKATVVCKVSGCPF